MKDKKIIQDYWFNKIKQYSNDTNHLLSQYEQTPSGKYSIFLNDRCLDKVNKLSGGNTIAAGTIYLSVFNALLKRYTNNELIWVASSPFHLQKIQHEKDTVVFFHTPVSNENSLKDIVNATKKEIEETLLYDAISFELIHNEFSNIEVTQEEYLHYAFIYKELNNKNTLTAQARLCLEIDDKNVKGLSITIHYDTAKYDSFFIENLTHHYNYILENISDIIDTKISGIEFITAFEKQQLLEFSGESEKRIEESVITVFHQQVLATPSNIALVHKGKKYTYAELNHKANHLAYCLQEDYGIKSGDIIGVMTDYSDYTILAFIAALKLGAGYLPLDYNLTEERLDYMLSDTQPKVIITQLEYLSHIINYSIPLFSADVMLNEENIPNTNQENINVKGDIAYIMYTSGSTGVPKGVVVKEKSIVRLVKETNYIKIESQDRILAISNPAFDGSTFDIWGVLLNGATLHIPEKDLVLNFELLFQAITQNEISVVFMTTALFNSMVDTDIESLSKLRKILFGGEMVSVSHVRKFINHNGSGKLIHVYGPTENTTFSTFHPVDEVLEEAQNIPIGKPISYTQCYILNESLKLQPIGISGELYVSGEGVAAGYLNKEELTSKSFIENPYSKKSLLYKTGDICKWLSNGSIEILGRRDNQVKIRGFRIELGEIERKITSFSTICEAVILVNKDLHDVKFLSAFFVADINISPDELHSYLIQKLPKYMVPSHLTQVPQIPLNRNGKTDEKELVKLAKSKKEVTRELVLPTTEIEKAVYQIWTELFDKEYISITDDFFDIGGHSIKAMNLVSMIHKNLDVKIDIGNVFEDRNIKAISETILLAKESYFKEIEALQEQLSYSVSSSQQRFWALSQFQEANKAYTIPSTYVFEGNLDKSALFFAFKTIVARHESFRTSFKENENQELRQIISHENGNFTIDCIDLRDRTENELENTIRNLIQVVFNLSEGPLLKVTLVQVQDSKWILVCVMHHIISDGLSMEVFIEELLHLYQAHKNNTPTNLKPLRIQYKDFAAWQNEELKDETLQVHKAYWIEKFSGELPVLNLQKSKIRPKIKTYNGDSLTVNIDHTTLQNFKNVLNSENLTLFMGLVSMVNVLIYKYTNQEDIILGSSITGRNHADLEKQIGCFINILPLRCQFSGEDSLVNIFRNVKKLTQEAYEHQIYPFDKLIGDLDLTHDISRNPLFDSTVVLQNADLDKKINALSNEGLEIALYEKIKASVSRFDISFNFVETINGLEFTLVYNTDIFDEVFIHQIQKHFESLLAAAAVNPNHTIAAIPYLSIGETNLLSSNFSSGVFNPEVCLDIVDAFQEQVNKTPDHIAVVYKNSQLTYQELNNNSDKVAHLLSTEYGVKKGDKIGIILDKSELFIATILGVLKAGAIYVPIDVESPQIRKQFIANDIDTNTIITQMEYMFDLDFFDGNIVAIDVQLDFLESAVFQQNKNQPEDPAYIMYTSGSTGNPKGVLVSHKGVTRLVKNTNYIDFNTVNAILSTGSVSFDASTFEFWGALLNGKKLVLCDKEDLLNTKKLSTLIKAEKVDTMWFTAGLLNQFADQDIMLFEDLTNILAGGEKLSSKHISKLLQTFPAVNLINGYGPTENTTFSATYKITSPVEDDIPIGKPINNSKAYILDQNLHLCPLGVIGEIYLAGDGLSLGYLNAEELNHEKFLNPDSLNNERVYKTGDLGLWLPDGNIKFFGRKDSQVKLRGYRIELNDIEKTLGTHPDINGAVVVLKQVAEAVEEKFIIAYVKANDEINKKDLKTYLSDRLPFYMIPTYFIQVHDFILNKNGKIDKDLLPDFDLAQLEREYVSYRNEIEKTLSEIWTEVLGIEKISITDDFFEIGGHSLRAVKLANMIQESFGIEISIGHVFQFRTIETMAEQLNFIQKQEQLTANKKDLQEIDIDL
ncbi:non-ribosomal peptide synthetase [Flavobacterium sp. Fl-77]|uniref:Non-ribosomal peptide synthetase n=1 Tax=Flavobacterium flavipigmentatum TaxID=2893884 RepID=A0AAJ2SGI9_9FLAO|nr:MULTISPECIES: non-ribosomal peptide synthetase [unclassified Flavobacterium]MDX6183161.1 non-ribosomal peptide synthetase [Flavobacterium sp. Fl-33]MDX6186770.1 non-ribosomal peptide synthetase [Flavobacterium sp. Fl-77]UFH40424.1 amino acid adenylation domain-containing protein [Flavobacterium sp. F-70]